MKFSPPEFTSRAVEIDREPAAMTKKLTEMKLEPPEISIFCKEMSC